jgi:uncharacterized membrane protein
MPSENGYEASGVEKVLAAMIVGVTVLSIMSFFAIIIGTWQGMTSDQFSSGLWPAITITPLFGLPVGFVLIIVLLVISTRRRRQSGSHDSSE